mgnify:FL=1
MRWRNAKSGAWRREYSIETEKYGREYTSQRSTRENRRPTVSWDDVWMKEHRSWKKYRLKQYKAAYARPPQEPVSPTLPLQKVLYVGRSTESHTYGQYYTVLESSFHWIKSLGFVVWVTTNDYPNTTDTDFCYEFKPKEFITNFKII